LLPLDELIRVIFKCAKALDYAHRKGVIHRDVKPKNILLTDSGDIKVSDFSVALRTGSDVTDTQVDGYLGSPLYMSPEQVKGESITSCSHVFSLGVMMYELLTGKAPFAGNTIATVIYQSTAAELSSAASAAKLRQPRPTAQACAVRSSSVATPTRRAPQFDEQCIQRANRRSFTTVDSRR
jgi:serine/threonine protein kinase